jgi:hypothetical protein
MKIHQDGPKVCGSQNFSILEFKGATVGKFYLTTTTARDRRQLNFPCNHVFGVEKKAQKRENQKKTSKLFIILYVACGKFKKI